MSVAPDAFVGESFAGTGVEIPFQASRYSFGLDGDAAFQRHGQTGFYRNNLAGLVRSKTALQIIGRPT